MNGQQETGEARHAALRWQTQKPLRKPLLADEKSVVHKHGEG